MHKSYRSSSYTVSPTSSCSASFQIPASASSCTSIASFLIPASCSEGGTISSTSSILPNTGLLHPTLELDPNGRLVFNVAHRVIDQQILFHPRLSHSLTLSDLAHTPIVCEMFVSFPDFKTNAGSIPLCHVTNPRGVTVRDVLEHISRFMLERIAQSELFSLLPDIRATALRTYGSSNAGTGRPMLRNLCLGQRQYFIGLRLGRNGHWEANFSDCDRFL